MKKEIITIVHHNDFLVDGIYIHAGAGSPLVIIINGHNGFYNYGMFPYLQESLFKNGISSYSFNFSHGGIIGDGDYFENLEMYAQNCMRLERDDLLAVLHNLEACFGNHSNIILLTHSLGGVPTLFGAKQAQKEGIPITGIILVSTVKTLRFWPEEMIEAWIRDGVFYKKNNRTKQELPQGSELLQEVLSSDTTWNVEQAIKSIKCPVLIVHGDQDEAVPVTHGEALYSWIKDKNQNASLEIIPGATHTYNTKHPFEGTTPQLEALIQVLAGWIKKV